LFYFTLRVFLEKRDKSAKIESESMLVATEQRQHIVTAEKKRADAETQSQFHVMSQGAVGDGQSDAEYLSIVAGRYGYLAIVGITWRFTRLPR